MVKTCKECGQEVLIEVQKKKCAKCGKIQPITNFGKHESSSDGHQSYCDDCKGGLHKAKRHKNAAFRVKHHFATRIKTQLGENCPEAHYANLEDLLGYKIKDLIKSMNKDIKERCSAGTIEDKEVYSARKALQSGWHIDHTVPLWSFKCKEVESAEGLANFQKCWEISNLKLIPADVNLAKGGQV